MQTATSARKFNVWAGASALQAFTSRGLDPAWANDNQPTNRSLKDSDTVILNCDTKGDFSNGTFLVPKGTPGIVRTARTARVVVRDGCKSQFFANVDVEIDGVKGRVRVPHGALRIVRSTVAH